MSDRDFRSIGEVLDLLKAEFPDITISKIRFLESQGLLDPERTPSGYRKFYDADVEKLRFILTEQRDRFLPLKVIKERIEAGELDGAAAPAAAAPAAEVTTPAPVPVESVEPAKPVAAKPELPTAASTGDDGCTREALMADTGLTVPQLADLARYGLVEEHKVGSTVHYDPHSAHVARLAVGFFEHGIEPRHLRMFRQAVDRETALVAQVASPYQRQRNPDARQRAAEVVSELGAACLDLHRSLLAREVRRMTDG